MVLRTWDVGLKPDAIGCHRSAVGRATPRANSRGATASVQPWVSTQGPVGNQNARQSRSDDSWRRVWNDLSPLRGFGLGLGRPGRRVETRRFRMSPLRGYWRCLDHAILSD
ncbi:hypothetical protein RBSH_05149 [Rhodopirellula baltica SH28]|uniref:Uncharacterized protein n=1 Tax=Rhodopirellula baltica SH28 TaxID=993517 RepID=K5CZH9_RHOBT|nr:hypothetical protein RBSH_05149 [Rhodopirellula baltica SH28]